jgi:hypothetical protein
VQLIDHGVELAFRPNAQGIDPGQLRALREPYIASIRLDDANRVFRQIAQLNIVVLVDADSVADGFGTVALHLLTKRFRVQSFIGQISRLDAIKTRSMHGTKIHPFVLQILGDGVDADARPDQMAGGASR